MLVRPHDGGIDGMLLVGWWPKTRQGFECGIPHAELAPACEAHKDRIPITVSLGHVAPRSAGAQNPENTVDRSPLVRDRWTTFAPIGEQRVENAPFRVRYIAPTQCCLLQKGSLESKLDSSVKNRQHALVPGLGGIARQSAAPSLIAALGQRTTLEGKPAVAFPIRFVDGTVFLGPFQVGAVPPLF